MMYMYIDTVVLSHVYVGHTTCALQLYNNELRSSYICNLKLILICTNNYSLKNNRK